MGIFGQMHAENDYVSLQEKNRLQKEAIEASLIERWGPRGPVLEMGKKVEDMHYHAVGKPIKTTRQQLQLLFGWYQQVTDRRTRVVMKAWREPLTLQDQEEEEGQEEEEEEYIADRAFRELAEFAEVSFEAEAEAKAKAAVKTKTVKHKQKFYTYKQALRVINKVTHERESQFLLVNPVFAKPSELERNYGRRTTDRLTEYHCLYAEIDHYNVKKALPKYHNLTAHEVLDAIVQKLKKHGFPPPTEAVFSRGPQLYWKIAPLPEYFTEEWSFAMQKLNLLLEEFGADHKALDGVRILRAVGSRHEVTGQLITGKTFSKDRLDFMYLFNQFCGEDWAEHLRKKELARQKRIENRAKKFEQKIEWMIENGYLDQNRMPTSSYNPSAKKQKTANKEAKTHFFSHRHQNVINGLMWLSEVVRKGNMEGTREVSCFLMYLFSLRAFGGVKFQALKNVRDLYDSFTDPRYAWDDLVQRIASAEKDYERWEKDHFAGYTYKSEKLIKVLEITPEEMQKMRYIVTPQRAQELRRERDRIRRKENYTVKLQESGKLSKKEQKEQQVITLMHYLQKNKEATNKQLFNQFGKQFEVELRTLKSRAAEARKRLNREDITPPSI